LTWVIEDPPVGSLEGEGKERGAGLKTGALHTLNHLNTHDRLFQVPLYEVGLYDQCLQDFGESFAMLTA